MPFLSSTFVPLIQSYATISFSFSFPHPLPFRLNAQNGGKKNNFMWGMECGYMIASSSHSSPFLALWFPGEIRKGAVLMVLDVWRRARA